MSRPTNQEIEDIRNQPKIDKAYNDALTSPEMVAPPPPRKKPKPGKKMASGGRVSASFRADGCCARGKTRGKMV